MNNSQKIKKIEQMLENIRGSAESDFYRNIWGNEKTFYNLPFISIENFIATPLRERTYKKEKGLAKIVRSGAKPFLVQCGLSDLKKENYGDVLCKRPLVLLSNSHEALEKSLWFRSEEHTSELQSQFHLVCPL